MLNKMTFDKRGKILYNYSSHCLCIKDSEWCQVSMLRISPCNRGPQVS